MTILFCLCDRCSCRYPGEYRAHSGCLRMSQQAAFVHANTGMASVEAVAVGTGSGLQPLTVEMADIILSDTGRRIRSSRGPLPRRRGGWEVELSSMVRAERVRVDPHSDDLESRPCRLGSVSGCAASASRSAASVSSRRYAVSVLGGRGSARMLRSGERPLAGSRGGHPFPGTH